MTGNRADRAGRAALPKATVHRVAILCAIGAALLGTGPLLPPASADGIGELAVEPATGHDEMGNIRVTSSADCPDPATHFVVRAEGGGFPANSNAVGTNEIAGFSPGETGDGLVIPLHGSWGVVAQANDPEEPLDGLVELTLVCMDLDGQEFGEMIGEVRFTRAGEYGSSFEQAGGLKLSSGIPLTIEEAAQYSYGAIDPSGDSGPGDRDQVGTSDTDSPGGSAPGAVAAGGDDPQATADDPSASASSAQAGPGPGPTGSAASRESERTEPVSASGRSIAATRTALVIGLAVLLIAGLGGALLYRAARARAPGGRFE